MCAHLTILSNFETLAIGVLERANYCNKLNTIQLITATGTLQWPNSCMEIAAFAGAKVCGKIYEFTLCS